jgi:protein TonB
MRAALPVKPAAAVNTLRPGQLLGLTGVVIALHLGGLWALQGAPAESPTKAAPLSEMRVRLAQAAQPEAQPRNTPAVTIAAPPASKPTPRMDKASPSPSPGARPDAQSRPRTTQVPAPVNPLPPGSSPATEIPVKADPATDAGPAPTAAKPASGATAPPVADTLPSSNAQYLNNPKPDYPALSRRLGESGQVVYQVWIGVDGKAQRAELVSSSGFPRLDKAAHDAVMGWRYVPGTRQGVPAAMAYNVPITWALRD